MSHQVFEQMPEDARLWVYPAGRLLQPAEQAHILAEVNAFLQSWRAHGKPLRASACIDYNYFLLLAADEHFAMPSGCAIDAQVGFVRELAKRYQLHFMERGAVYFQHDHTQIAYMPLAQIGQAIEEGTIHANTLIFHHAATRKKEWGVQPAAQSWLARYWRLSAAS